MKNQNEIALSDTELLAIKLVFFSTENVQQLHDAANNIVRTFDQEGEYGVVRDTINALLQAANEELTRRAKR